MVVGESLPDLEAAWPPPTKPGATNEVVDGCSTLSSKEPDSVARLFTAINFLRGILVVLWVYMIYAMVCFARNHNNEQGWELIIMFLVFIAIGVTPCFGIAAQVLDDAEAYNAQT